MSDDLHSRLPQTWADAFAAMPSETAPADGWSRLQATLDADAPRNRTYPSIYGVRRHRVALVALAASLALVAAIPRVMHLEGADEPPARRAATRRGDVPAVFAPMRPEAARDVVPTGKHDARTGRTEGVAAAVPPHDDARPPSVDRRVRSTRDAARVAVTRSRTPITTGMPDGDAMEPLATDSHRISTTGEPTEAEFARLYAESAQLEALLALTRDDRVQSATAAVLADDLDARIGLIDAALAEPGLSGLRRFALWRQRVTTLRERAGIESSERWLAANGTAMGDALVRVD